MWASTIVDDCNEKIGRKIRDNELKRIPYLLIVGEKEMAEEPYRYVNKAKATKAVCVWTNLLN